MKVGWQTKTLGELAEVFADGDWVESKDQSTEGVRLIQTGNVGEGFFKDRGDKARYISEATFKRLRCTEIFEGDCLISRLPDPVGRCCLLPDTGERMITAVDCTIVRFDSKQIIPVFFNYYSQSTDYLDAVDAETSGTTRNRISRANLGKIAVPVPPLPEQQRIVGILDAAFEGIATAKANAEQNLRNARALFESHLQSVFTQRGEGWVRARMDAIYRVGSSKRVLKSEWKSEGVPFYRGREVTRLAANGFVDNELFISEEHFAELSKEYGVPKSGDIVITAIGTIGNAHIVRGSDRFYFKDASVLWMKRSAEVSSEFIKFWLKSSLFFDQLDRGNGATVDTLTIQKLQSVELFLPPIDEQLKIVAQLDSLSEETQRLESLYQRKLAALDELKKSLLHQAFSGQLIRDN